MRARLFTTSICTLMLLFGLAVQAQDWAGNGRAQGVVTDADKKPVEGAKVTMVLNGAGPKPILTDKKGRWAFLGLSGGDWTATIEKEGYNLAEGTVHIIAGAIGPGQMQRTTLNK